MYFHKLSPTFVPSGLAYNFMCQWRQFVVHVNEYVAIKDVISVAGIFKN